MSGRLSGFSKLTIQQRLSQLEELGFLQSQDALFLKNGGNIPSELGEKFIENMIGYFQMPLGVAPHFKIDGKDYLIPMAVEETSIIAAAAKTAKWINESGFIETQQIGTDIIGQIQISKVQDLNKLKKIVSENQKTWIQSANEIVAPGLVRRGGGVRSMKLRTLARPDGNTMGILHVYLDPVDAMGANIINQVCEFLKLKVEAETHENVTMCILSNLVDSRLTRSKIILEKISSDLIDKICEASLFAELDPYRAATNNKGVMNGIDPILVATGNDWRAVEAGVHSYAAKDGRYSSITKWWRDGNNLVGQFEAPLVVGTVGGVTRLHPMAQLSMRILGVENASQLSRIAAAVGLTQNLGALRALTTVGIIEGHMKLHIKNLSLASGATEVETPILYQKLEAFLCREKRISLQNAVDILNEIREERANHSKNSNEKCH
jgi:hydroxymethylglutaryl-CoA reductase